MPVFAMRALLPDEEYYQWMIYLRYKKPSINEIQLANISALIIQAVGGKAKVSDFILSDNETPTKSKGDKDAAFRSFDAVGVEYRGPAE